MLDEFADALLSAADPGEVGRLFQRQAAACGFSSSAYRAVAPGDPGTPSVFVFRDWPDDWARVSDQEDLSANSFTAIEARQRSAGFSWRDVKAGRELSEGEQRVWNVAYEWGWRDGFVIPIRGPLGSLSLVSMASTETDLDLSLRQRASLQMMALLVDERYRAFSAALTAEQVMETLTRRELECLRWVAAGKTDWEIGVILTISATTVKSHVDRAREKFGARTRAQAVARLVLCGLY